MRILRSDADGRLSRISTLSLPPGLLGDVASVPVRCTEAQATAAACPADSHVGSVMVGSGPGPDPFYVPGDVYLMGQFHAGPFAGDPFGLAVVVHALAGPLDLGYVVVRTGLQINSDGSITARSEPFPQMLQGIPLDIRDVQLHLDRPGFTFNPTDCNPLQVGGQLASVEGLTENVSERFQAGDCASLTFKPSFTATTQGNGTFNRNGASLDVKIATGQGPGSGEANIRKVEVQLPKRLPARLTTLQKACTEAQFAANPAGCPAASDVGIAVAHTPILASPLSGPAYLVSHGGQAFPDLVLILQGEGITLHVTGHTQIKNGITYSRFETVPDAPISSFELNLPESPFSALAATESLCSSTRTITVRKRMLVHRLGHTRRVTRAVRQVVTEPLAMPTKITAQNGTVLEQNTQIAVSGCPGTKSVRKHKTNRHGHGKGR
jgi:hypothetical protein